MAIKDLYKQVQADKKNKIKDDNEIYSMPRKDAISEHQNLVKVLRSGDKKAQEVEAVKQEKELAEMMKGDTDNDPAADSKGNYTD